MIMESICFTSKLLLPDSVPAIFHVTVGSSTRERNTLQLLSLDPGDDVVFQRGSQNELVGKVTVKNIHDSSVAFKVRLISWSEAKAVLSISSLLIMVSNGMWSNCMYNTVHICYIDALSRLIIIVCSDHYFHTHDRPSAFNIVQNKTILKWE